MLHPHMKVPEILGLKLCVARDTTELRDDHCDKTLTSHPKVLQGIGPSSTFVWCAG